MNVVFLLFVLLNWMNFQFIVLVEFINVARSIDVCHTLFQKAFFLLILKVTIPKRWRKLSLESHTAQRVSNVHRVKAKAEYVKYFSYYRFNIFIPICGARHSQNDGCLLMVAHIFFFSLKIKIQKPNTRYKISFI